MSLTPRLTASLVLALALAQAGPGHAQVPVDDWTERPDARAPSGVGEDALPAPRTFEAEYHFQVMQYDQIRFGTDEVPPILVLQDWDMVPLTMTTQRHEIELRAGYLEWLAFSARIPVRHVSAELATLDTQGIVSSFGIGDVELYALYGLHDRWPYRAHLIGGAAFPTGRSDDADRLPNAPQTDRVLPYPMQPGEGTFALLPGAVLVAENEVGTVGFKVNARIPVGENSAGWNRGTSVDGQLWMAVRFTDWVSGSARLQYQSLAGVSGFDANMDPQSSPMAHPNLHGGTRLLVPIGVNLAFPEGALRGNRLRAELVLPVHQDLDGPQMGANAGAAFSWGMTF